MKPPIDRMLIKKRDFYRFAVAHSDMCVAANICEHYQTIINQLEPEQKIPHPLNYAFMSSIVTAYVRPFSRGDLGELPHRFIKFPYTPLKAMHERMLKSRNEVYAHSDSAFRLTVFPAGCPVPGRVAPHMGTWALHTYEFPPEDIIAITGCVLFVRDGLLKEVSTLIDEIGTDWKPGEPPIEIQWTTISSSPATSSTP